MWCRVCGGTVLVFSHENVCGVVNQKKKEQDLSTKILSPVDGIILEANFPKTSVVKKWDVVFIISPQQQENKPLIANLFFL